MQLDVRARRPVVFVRPQCVCSHTTLHLCEQRPRVVSVTHIPTCRRTDTQTHTVSHQTDTAETLMQGGEQRHTHTHTHTRAHITRCNQHSEVCVYMYYPAHTQCVGALLHQIRDVQTDIQHTRCIVQPGSVYWRPACPPFSN